MNAAATTLDAALPKPVIETAKTKTIATADPDVSLIDMTNQDLGTENSQDELIFIDLTEQKTKTTLKVSKKPIDFDAPIKTDSTSNSVNNANSVLPNLKNPPLSSYLETACIT